MSVVIALLRAVNVGGRSLKMADLVVLARDLGFAQPRTLAQSGNLVFETEDAPDAALERRMEAEAECAFRVRDRFRRPLGRRVADRDREEPLP